MLLSLVVSPYVDCKNREKIMAQAKVKVGYDEVVPRDLTFDLNKDNVHKYWFNDDPWNTLWMTAVLAAVPEGERWVMRSAAMLLDKIDDPAVRQAGVDFCKQERIHAREHDVMNEISIEHGLPLDDIESTFVVIREFLKKNLSPEMQGALAASFEHFTAILSSVFLEYPEMFEDTEPEVVNMLFWHFVEETEHKAVSFDVFSHASGKGPLAYLRRVTAMATSSVVGVPGITAALVYLLWKDKQFTNLPSALKMLDTTLVRPGVMRHIVKLYFPYYRPSFHPWKDDNRDVIHVWKKSFDETGDAGAAFKALCDWHKNENPRKVGKSSAFSAIKAKFAIA